MLTRWAVFWWSHHARTSLMYRIVQFITAVQSELQIYSRSKETIFMLTFLDVCSSFCVYFQPSLLGTSLCETSLFMPGLLRQHKSHNVCTEKREGQITWHISDLLLYLDNDAGFSGRIEGITDYHVASLSVAVGPVCLVGLPFDWIMIPCSYNERHRWTKKHFALNMHTSNYLSMLCACWWTVTCRLSKYESQRKTPMMATR